MSIGSSGLRDTYTVADKCVVRENVTISKDNILSGEQKQKPPTKLVPGNV